MFCINFVCDICSMWNIVKCFDRYVNDDSENKFELWMYMIVYIFNIFIIKCDNDNSNKG